MNQDNPNTQAPVVDPNAAGNAGEGGANGSQTVEPSKDEKPKPPRRGKGGATKLEDGEGDLVVDERVRIVCKVMLTDLKGGPVPLRDTIIDHLTFATVKIDGVETHISEKVGAEDAARYREMAGYSIFEGDEYDRVIEDALDRARAATPGSGLSSTERSYKVQLEEQQEINQRMAGELRQKDADLLAQADEIRRLKGELARLREETGRK